MKKLFKFLEIIRLIFVHKKYPPCTTRFSGETGKLKNPDIPAPNYCTIEQHHGIRFWKGYKFCPHCGTKINPITTGGEINLGNLIKKIQANNSIL